MSLYEIITDPNAMTVTVGPRVYNDPRLQRVTERDLRIKYEICGDPPTDDLKGVYQFYASKVGSKFNRRFQAAHYRLWIGERMLQSTGNMLRIGGMRWRVYNNALVYRANQCLPYVNEAEADGLHNLIPAIVSFCASPQEIRRTVGGGAWRRIAHNSKTRNTLIMQAVERCVPEDRGDCFVQLLDFASGHLRAVHDAGEDEVMAARLAPRKIPEVFLQTVHTIRDTRRMVLGGFNPVWGLARIQQEHDAAVRTIRSKRFSDARFADDWAFSEGKYTATLLTNPLDIAVEGDGQRHCVGSYANEAARGNYAVLRVEGAERATIGLRPSFAGWRIDQVYAAFNQPVSQACLDFAAKVSNAYGDATGGRQSRAA